MSLSGRHRKRRTIPPSPPNNKGHPQGCPCFLAIQFKNATFLGGISRPCRVYNRLTIGGQVQLCRLPRQAACGGCNYPDAPVFPRLCIMLCFLSEKHYDSCCTNDARRVSVRATCR